MKNRKIHGTLYRIFRKINNFNKLKYLTTYTLSTLYIKVHSTIYWNWILKIKVKFVVFFFFIIPSFYIYFKVLDSFVYLKYTFKRAGWRVYIRKSGRYTFKGNLMLFVVRADGVLCFFLIESSYIYCLFLILILCYNLSWEFCFFFSTNLIYKKKFVVFFLKICFLFKEKLDS